MLRRNIYFHLEDNSRNIKDKSVGRLESLSLIYQPRWPYISDDRKPSAL